MNKPIILIGFFSEAIELCERAQYEIVGIVDKEPPLNCRYDYLGNDNELIGMVETFRNVPLFLVPDAPKVRKDLFMKYREKGFHFATVISPFATVSPSAYIDEGCMIQDGCNISANARLGKCVRVNSIANIMHDSVIGDFSTVAPNCVILGRCSIGEEAYIGANSTILPGKKIEKGGVVGAGAVVTKDIGEWATVVGVPARPMGKEVINH